MTKRTKRVKARGEIPLITYLETKFQLGVSGKTKEEELEEVCQAIKELLYEVDIIMTPRDKVDATRTVVAEISVKTVIGLQDLQQMSDMKEMMEKITGSPVAMREVSELAEDCKVLTNDNKIKK